MWMPNDAPDHRLVSIHKQLITGSSRPTTNPDIIRDWFSTDPTANIGISLADSGLIALDIGLETVGYNTQKDWQRLSFIQLCCIRNQVESIDCLGQRKHIVSE